MTDIVILFVYVMGLLVVFVYPSIWIVDKLKNKMAFIDAHSNTIAIILAFILSLIASSLLY